MGWHRKSAAHGMIRMHWILLGLSLLTVAGVAAGSHGYLLFVP
jgi:hypothetical protein